MHFRMFEVDALASQLASLAKPAPLLSVLTALDCDNADKSISFNVSTSAKMSQ